MQAHNPTLFKTNFPYFLFCFFISSIFFLPVLNLPQFGLKIGFIGLGAVLTYITSILFLIPKIKVTFRIQKIILALSLIILFDAGKLSIYGQLFNLFKSFQAVIMILVFYYLGYSYLNSGKKVYIFSRIIIVSMILLALLGVAHFYFFPNVDLADKTAYTNDYMGLIDYVTMKYRESSTISSPVSFGHLMIFGIIFCLFCIRTKAKWAYICILFYAIIISGTKSALIYFLFLICALSLRRKSNFVAILLTLTLLISITLLASSDENIFSINQIAAGLDVRILKAGVGIQSILLNVNNFLFGVPPNLEIEIEGITLSDNSYLQLFEKSGVIGFSIIILLIRLFFSKFKNYKYYDLDVSTENYIRSVKHCAIAFLIFALSSNIFAQGPENVFMFLLLGSICNGKLSKTNIFFESNTKLNS